MLLLICRLYNKACPPPPNTHAHAHSATPVLLRRLPEVRGLQAPGTLALEAVLAVLLALCCMERTLEVQCTYGIY